jgi:AAA15 family ATPase/GTPase
MSYNVLESRTYTLFINSADKISGTNNNASFFVDWCQVLPDAYNEYKMIFTFQTSGGYYKDLSGSAIYSTAKVSADFGSRQFAYDTAKRGPTNTIGYISRDQQTTTTSSNILSCFYYQYPAKTMVKPTNTVFTVSVTNMYSGLALVNTDGGGNPQSDMTPWQACFEFFPISSSLNNDMKFHNL